MAKSSTASKQTKKPTSDCHCGESKNSAKSKSSKTVKGCDCTESK